MDPLGSCPHYVHKNWGSSGRGLSVYNSPLRDLRSRASADLHHAGRTSAHAAVVDELLP
jgi:hypothetical protein